MKRFFLSLCVMQLLLCSAFSREWIPLDGKHENEAVTMSVLQSDAFGYKVKVAVHGLYDETVQNEKGIFHSLSLGRVESLLTKGNPALPCINQIIAIPPDAIMSVSVEEDEWKELDMGLIYPAQSQFLAENNVFHINDTVYQHPFIPSILKVGKENTWRGIRHAGVSVCPFRYYPQENRLSVLCSFTLKVEFNQKRITDIQKVDTRFGLFDNTVYKKNKKDSNIRSSNDENYDYLIIVGLPDSIKNTAQFDKKMTEFRIWKALKGFRTKIRTYMPQSEILDTIMQERANGISYVLLIGDSIPLVETSGHRPDIKLKGDYYYGCDQGTNEADISVGRFPVSSFADFKNMVEKTIKYESCAYIEPIAMLIAHRDHTYRDCCVKIDTTHYTLPYSFWTAYGNDGNYVTNQYVTGETYTLYHNIINYRGHGGVNFWGDPYWNDAGESFTSSEINNMDSGKWPVIFSIACYTGNIESDTICMLETFTRSDHGAVAFIGATNTTDTGANNDYDKILFRKLLNDNVYRLGDLNILSHIQNIQNYIPFYGTEYTALDIAFSYLCGGDPTLELWTAHPTRINATVTPTDNSITINIGNNLGAYTLYIVSANGDLLDSISCSNSTCTFPIPTDKFYFSIYKHNCVPYIYYYDRISNEISGITFTYDAYFKASPFEMNNSVFVDYSGPVIVKPNNRLFIKNGSEGINISRDFKCEKGAIFEVK